MWRLKLTSTWNKYDVLLFAAVHYIQKNKSLSHFSFSDLSMLSPVSLFSSSRFLRTRDWILFWYGWKILAFNCPSNWHIRDIFFGITPMSRGQFIHLLYMSNRVGTYKNHICCYAERCCPILLDSRGLSLFVCHQPIPWHHHFQNIYFHPETMILKTFVML